MGKKKAQKVVSYAKRRTFCTLSSSWENMTSRAHARQQILSTVPQTIHTRPMLMFHQLIRKAFWFQSVCLQPRQFHLSPLMLYVLQMSTRACSLNNYPSKLSWRQAWTVVLSAAFLSALFNPVFWGVVGDCNIRARNGCRKLLPL